MCCLSDEGERGEGREDRGEGGVVYVTSTTGIGLSWSQDTWCALIGRNQYARLLACMLTSYALFSTAAVG